MLYFAFGSNMLTARLQRRCPTARVVTRATAPGYSVAFDKLSEDTSGKANLVAGDQRSPAIGIVYELSSDDIDRLDGFEGAGYRREDHLAVTCLDTGTRLSACTYVAKARVPGLRPYDWYLALILAGLAGHAVDSSYAGRLYIAGFETDPLASRRSRLNALRDLDAAGYADYRALLRQPP